MDFSQKSEYLIRSIEDDGYMKLLKNDAGKYVLQIYHDNGVIEIITFNYISPLMNYDHKYIYFGDIDNPYKYIDYDLSSSIPYIYYNIPTKANYYAKVSSASGLNYVALTIRGTSSSDEKNYTKGTLLDKSVKVIVTRNDVTTEDYYGMSENDKIASFKIQTNDGSYIYLAGPYGSSLDPATYPFETIYETRTLNIP